VHIEGIQTLFVSQTAASRAHAPLLPLLHCEAASTDSKAQPVARRRSTANKNVIAKSSSSRVHRLSAGRGCPGQQHYDQWQLLQA
jgi:hypothetical protein